MSISYFDTQETGHCSILPAPGCGSYSVVGHLLAVAARPKQTCLRLSYSMSVGRANVMKGRKHSQQWLDEHWCVFSPTHVDDAESDGIDVEENLGG